GAAEDLGNRREISQEQSAFARDFARGVAGRARKTGPCAHISRCSRGAGGGTGSAGRSGNFAAAGRGAFEGPDRGGVREGGTGGASGQRGAWSASSGRKACGEVAADAFAGEEPGARDARAHLSPPRARRDE